MTGGDQRIPFFTDNDVDDDVGEFLRDSGHDVIRLRDVMLNTSTDPVVATACRENGRVLITHNYRHFREIIRRYEIAKREIDRLCRVEMGCEQINSLDRIRMELPVIEFEWARLGEEKSGLRIFIGKNMVRVHR